MPIFHIGCNIYCNTPKLSNSNPCTLIPDPESPTPLFSFQLQLLNSTPQTPNFNNQRRQGPHPPSP